MATLPLVNTNTYDNSSSLERISGTLKKRLNISTISKSLSSPMIRYNSGILNGKKGIDTTASSEVKSVDVLKRIYRFFVSDSLSQNEFDRIEQREKDNSDENIDDIQLSYLKDIGEQTQETKKEESFFDKVLNFLQYFTYGTFIYKHWDTISKFLGLEKITETIKELSDEFGITKIIDDVKSAIDDILKEFTFPTKVAPSMTGGGPSEPSKYDELFQKIGKEQGVDPALLKSVAKAESSFKSGAVSPKGAMGLMQLMPSTVQRFGVPVGKEFDPEENIRGGAKYLNFLMKKYEGDMTKAIAAYNAGEGNVDKYKDRGIPPFKETQQYVEKVKGYYTQTSAPVETGVPQSSTMEQPKSTSSSFSDSIKPKVDSFDGMESSKPSTNQYTRVPKKTQTKSHSEEGELGGQNVGQSIPSIENQTLSGVSNEGDLNGLNFVNHGAANPLSIEKQITRLQASKLQLLKQSLGITSLKIVSGTRTSEHNKAVGGAQHSEHLNGRATDIDTSGMTDDERVAFVKAATKVGFGGVGVYGSFIHLDTGKVRVWKQTSVSPAMSEALSQHKQGRSGQTVDVSTPIQPSLSEGGEVGAGQSTTQEPKQRSLLDQISSEINSMSNMFDQLTSSGGVEKTLEKLLEPYMTNIPKKDKQVPDVPAPFMQTNMMLNVNEEKKYFNQPNNTGHDDIPPIFASQYNDFLSQISK